MNTTATQKNNKEIPSQLEGFFSIGRNDIGYVKNKDLDLIIEIPKHEWNTALNRDTVAVTIEDKKALTGKITEIVHRAKVAFAGTISEKEDYFQLVPSDRRDPEVIIPKKDLPTPPAEDEKVIVTIDRWEAIGPVGHITKTLGKVGDNDAEMVALALERGFDDAFPPEVQDEADELKKIGIPDAEIKNRRDMRGTLTFTIDPQDAKDFDDAISFKVLENGNYEIGVHIADVSFYMRPDSAIEQEAQERTTSVYLVDRTIPMLPEILSNDLCSLRPNEEKLTYAAIFEIQPDGKVINEWFGRTIIESDKRFTYEEAQENIDTQSGEYFKELTILNNLAKGYTDYRMKNGAMNINSTEVKFILDDNGKPLKVQKKHTIDTNRLVEEFMLLANRAVAKFMGERTQKSVFIYRIHDKPDLDRTQDLHTFLKSLGHNLPIKDGVIPAQELNKLSESIEDEDKRTAVQTAIVRSMSKAIYSTDNIGHYGLGFTYYTHFTSPIRRYPDVMVHRLMTKVLTDQEISRDDFEFYRRMANRSSAREKDAQNAEWDSIKYKQVEYMGDHIGEVFEGIISGAMSKGIFVTERETQASGMIRLKDLGKDYFEFDEKKFIVRGRNTKKEFHIGDNVTIKVVSTDLKNGFINFAIVPEGK